MDPKYPCYAEESITCLIVCWHRGKKEEKSTIAEMEQNYKIKGVAPFNSISSALWVYCVANLVGSMMML